MAEQNHVIDKSGQVEAGKVPDTIGRIEPGRRDRILHDFEGFKSYLSKRIEMGKAIGLGEEQMAKLAEKVADYLAANEEPRNAEEKLLQELWKVGEQEERHKLAHMLVRLASANR